MHIDALELFWIKMPMVGKFTTSFGTTQEREILLVKATAGGAEGWGESGAARVGGRTRRGRPDSGHARHPQPALGSRGH